MNWSPVILLFFSAVVFGQKTPNPAPSADAYQQAQYHIYKRQFPEAKRSLQMAIQKYFAEGKKDSTVLSLLFLARMHTLTQKVDSAASLVDSSKALMVTMRDTLPLIKALIPYVETGIQMMRFNIPAADSMGWAALKKIDESIGPCNLIKINMLNDVGIIKHIQHRYDVGDSLVSAALNCGQELYEETSMRLVPSYNLTGSFADNRGYTQKAIRYYKAALNAMEANDLANSYDYARVLANLANAIYEVGGALEAIELLQRSVALTKEEEDLNNNIGTGYYNIANMFYSIGYRNKALEYLNMAEGRFIGSQQGQTPTLHFLYQLRSRIHALLGNVEKSEEDYQSAIDIIESSFGQDDEIISYFQLTRSHTLHQLQRYEEELQLLQKGIAGFRKYGWDPIPNNLGEFYYRAGDVSLILEDTSAAIEYYQSSIEVYKQADSRLKIEMAYSYGALADLYLAQGQIDSARSHIQRALQQVSKHPEAYDLLSSPPLESYARFHAFRHLLSSKIHILNALYAQTGDDRYLKTALTEADKLEEHLSSTSSAYLEGNDAIERVKTYWPHYEEIIKTRITAFEATGEKIYLVDALSIAEQTKDVLYKMSLKAASPVQVLGLSVEDAEKEQAFQRDIERLEEELHHVELSENQTTIDSLEKVLFDVHREYDIFKKRLSQSNPQYYKVKYGVQELDLDAIQAMLRKKDATLVNYFIGDRSTLAFIIDADKIEYLELSDPDSIEEPIDNAIHSLRNLGDLQPLNELFEVVFEPLEETIETDNIIVIPDGKLHFLPFEALRNNSNSFLIEKYNILYSHSIDPLLQSSTAEELDSILGVAPGFDDDIKSFLKSEFPNYDHIELLRQPNAVSMLRNLGSKIPGTYLIAGQASEYNFKRRSHRSDVLVLATHAEVDEAHPLFSRIALLPSDSTSEDGWLHTYEIFGLNLDQDLAILTACQTGLGALDRGQGVASLSHAFRYAGCQNILMSLWSIDEKQSVEITEDFLGRVKNGNDISQALTDSKRHYLFHHRGDLVHPYYWAGLVLVGQGGNMPVGHWWIPWIIGAFVVVGIAIIIWRVKRKRRKADVPG
ncbi:MAG: CHAT domain-containing tetratricopeptide repeat protein [Saprospiraceae bacterium]|nr:CHAT domain-containing tetratricopeptide repeat protein [Saprospiraceae bacterium]